MMTGLKGTFVISWSQTSLDGIAAAPLRQLDVGATWRWGGEAVCVDTSQGPLRLCDAQGAADARKRAARAVKRLVGAALEQRNPGCDQAGDPGCDLQQDASDDRDQGFFLTDGRNSFTATIIKTPHSPTPLVMFHNDVPPRDTDLWVVRKLRDPGIIEAGEAVTGEPETDSVICFASDTLIRTEGGLRPVQDLAPGDRVLTRDDGPQEILWIGARRMTGARLYAMPTLRPIRFRAGALGIDRPERDLLVSPHHRMLVRGRTAQSLFNAPEVLVRAQDLVNNRSIAVDRALREVTYIHLMFERHQVIWANGLETESFHPALTSLDLVEAPQRASLLAMFPALVSEPHSYGAYARRMLSMSEAAILLGGGKVLAA